MDLPSQRALIQSRIDNLKESQENFENGKLDSYSRRYASIMGGYFQRPPGTTEQIAKKENKRAQNMRALQDK
jgi:hypothetical protein